MATLAITIDLPPAGELEVTGNGTEPTQAQMDEETKWRNSFIDAVSSYLASLPGMPPQRMGNVSRVELLGRNEWSTLNHYLLLVTVDIGDRGIEDHLADLLPPGSKVTGLGDFESLQTWPNQPNLHPHAIA
jgi:hypothetical protein